MPDAPEDSIQKNTRLRQDYVAECLQFYSYDDARHYQNQFGQALDSQLERCGTCITGYYKVKKRLGERLRQDFDESDVFDLERIITDRDLERIKGGLKEVKRKLLSVESRLRTKNVVDFPGLLSLFEALCNESLLHDDAILADHFQEPFDLIQTNKPLKVPTYVPAATIFLFAEHHNRRSWAARAWHGYLESPKEDDFEFAVRKPLLEGLRSVSENVPDEEILQRVWYGFGLILNKLDSHMITQALHTMDVNPFLLALDNLKYDAAGFSYLLQAIRKLFDIAPRDFWDALQAAGAVSPTTFIEQVFNNPRLDKILQQQGGENRNDAQTKILDALSWIRPFMSSVETAHHGRALRSLAFQLLNRLQADRFPKVARIECLRNGLSIMEWTLHKIITQGSAMSTTGRVAASEALEVVDEHATQVLKIFSLPSTDELRTHCLKFSLNVVQAALVLDCRCLRSDQNSLRQGVVVPEEGHAQASAIWDSVIARMERSNLSLARAALAGFAGLSELEKFKVNPEDSLTKGKSAFNIKLGRVNHYVCQVLEKINDFDPDVLDGLYTDPDTANALLSSLVSPDAGLYEAGVNLIKTVSSESARKEAIGHLLKTAFGTTLDALSSLMARTARSKTFACCSRLFKLLSDILDILCEPSEGLLRTDSQQVKPHSESVKSFWSHQWTLLEMIYGMVEHWSNVKAADAEVLKEFCRDTMQFSARLFEQYDVFANSFNPSANEIKIESRDGQLQTTKHDLLRQPTAIMDKMVKWIRLRDHFLVDTCTDLIKQMLKKLTENRLRVSENNSGFLEKVVNNAPQTRTNLSSQQKAEIARALEANVGRSIMQTSVVNLDSDPASEGPERPALWPKKTKSATIDLEDWKSKTNAQTKVIRIEDDDVSDSDYLKRELASVSRSLSKMDALKASREFRTSKMQAVPSESSATKLFDKRRDKGNVAPLKTNAEQASFMQKREQEKEAKKKRDAANAALIRRRAVNGLSGQTSGEGSGIEGLGVKGKDHATKGPNLMVSSDSESDSEESDDGFFREARKPVKAVDHIFEYHKSMAAKGPVKKVRVGRSVKDMRARLAPDLTPLHKTLLGWDFFHEGDFPPGSLREGYIMISNTFRTPKEYCDVFEPLLLLEAWQGILQSKDEGNFKNFEIKVAGRMSVDAFLELSATMSPSNGRDIGLSEADIVLLSKHMSPAKARDQPHCLVRVSKIKRKKAVWEVTFRANLNNDLANHMAPNNTLYVTKVDSITPLEREYGSLLGLKYYDLCDEIIKAKPSPLLPYSNAQLKPLVEVYDVNMAQAKAIKSAMDNDAFTLIQGPPGSGKTKTIVATVGALLTGASNFGDRGVLISRPSQAHSQQQSATRMASKKLLICAPSNAAVDELVMRFKEGIKLATGEQQAISVVRLGRSDAINAKVLDVTLEELVNAKLNVGTKKKANNGEDIQKLMSSHKEISQNLNYLRNEIDAQKAAGKPVSSEQNREFDTLKRRKQQLSNQIDAARDSGEIAARDAEISRRKIQQEILDNSHVICATLSGSGHDMFQNLNIEFETVVIDEAAQSIELSALIPLKYGCSKCILVGDPKQLPPTVLSREASRFQYEQSLFVRMQSNHPDSVHLLDTQYRMHPHISSFPSKAFYDGKLLDGPDMETLRTRAWHRNPILGPYTFFDVQGMQKSATQGHSLTNFEEIEVALKLYACLLRHSGTMDLKGKVGIITPYKSQLKELRIQFARRYGDEIFAQIEFNTTDAFQGRESEVIIFSCVRASASGGIGFLADIRRMNVGITRAKSSLWVLGNARSLQRGEFWGRLIDDAKNRKLYVDGDLSELDRALPDGGYMEAIEYGGANNDVEMADAPLATKPMEKQGATDSRENKFNPQGGLNGLNDMRSCQWCGSLAHDGNGCDNMEARKLANADCGRCGKPGHTRNFCKADLCILCGDIGHTALKCSNPITLSKKDREQLIRREGARQERLRDLEAQKKRLMGEHDRKVPIVKTTEQTQAADQKALNRLQTVPNGAPTGPKAISGSLGLLTGRQNDHPLKGVHSKTNGGQSGAAGPTMQTSSGPEINAGITGVVGNTPTIKKSDGALPQKPPAGRLLQSNVRPPKRKSGAEPFIPKKKR